jgi:hypothetical protein
MSFCVWGQGVDTLLPVTHKVAFMQKGDKTPRFGDSGPCHRSCRQVDGIDRALSAAVSRADVPGQGNTGRDRFS